MFRFLLLEGFELNTTHKPQNGLMEFQKYLLIVTVKIAQKSTTLMSVLSSFDTVFE